MTFRRIVYSALLVGLAAGLFLSLLQHFQVTPIILAAEEYEIAEAPVAVLEGQGGHHQEEGAAHEHDAEAWAPEDGIERTLYTALSNVLAASGMAMLLISLMSLRRGVDAKTGLLWGVAGYLALFVAPGLGLPPEIPGMEAAALEGRQAWWVLTVTLSAVGLATLAFAPSKLKVGGLALLVLPHLIGAPQPEVHGFAHPDPNAVAVLEQLEHSFIQATALANALYWLVIGTLSGYLVKRFINQPVASRA